MTPPVDDGLLINPAGAGLRAATRRPVKSAGAFRTISEVATDLNVPQHVLRFWETRFAQIRPLKRAGGRRYYRPEDVELLRKIRELLYNNGYTIKGVQRLLRDSGRRPDEPGYAERTAAAQDAGQDADIGLDEVDPLPGTAEAAPDRAAIDEAVAELESIRDLLRRSRG